MSEVHLTKVTFSQVNTRFRVRAFFGNIRCMESCRNPPVLLRDPQCLRGLDSIVRAVERVLEAHENQGALNPSLSCTPKPDYLTPRSKKCPTFL